MDQQTIGQRIKELRKRMILTQKDLGMLIGVTGSAISQYEKDQVNIGYSEIVKLAVVFNVDASYLMVSENVSVPNSFKTDVYEVKGLHNEEVISINKIMSQNDYHILKTKNEVLEREINLYKEQIEFYKEQLLFYRERLQNK